MFPNFYVTILKSGDYVGTKWGLNQKIPLPYIKNIGIFYTNKKSKSQQSILFQDY